ncbi:peptidoglycan-recognition protein SA-like isoform X2 [Phlebotomus papatasi]|uniref:peptidoglycan-recognition protein SA-like isoform X2 n=1 Tax=Phlebotomus papatasi TaxID=29031 RepID=UPI002483D030|nr:peptidoglycan-recognition protein SA-like isoform X2 [Phlebotomus papatasi]
MLVTEAPMPPNIPQDPQKGILTTDDASSTKSNNISIESLPEDDDASSIMSDSSDEYRESAEKPELGNRARSYAIGAMNQVNRIGTNGVLVIDDQQQVQNSPDRPPKIETVAVSNSSDITFGNKTFINGPVTIKQFIKESQPQTPNGRDNPGYDGSNRSLNVDSSTQSTYKEKLFAYKTWILVGITFLFALVGIICLTVFLTAAEEVPKQGDDLLSAANTTLRLVSRSEWIAQPPNDELVDLILPAHRVVIAHTATEDCDTQASCVYRVRFIQTFHMESRGWDDIGYNFLVGGDGSAYEGRGWDKVGAHTKGFNVDSICIAFIGTFTKNTPPERQLLAAQKVIQWGVDLGKLSKDYRLFGHRQLIPTESPGAALYAIIKKWPHWSKDPS